MVSIQEARSLIAKYLWLNESERVSIDQSVDRVLGTDILSPIDLPSFRQSAMDGYAMRKSDIVSGELEYSLIGEVQAGKYNEVRIDQGETVRIFTGACVPDDADTVVIQERVSKEGNKILIEKGLASAKSNIREIGEQLKTGEMVMAKGDLITPAGVGLLANLGIETVEVIERPKIALLTTGNELKKAGNQLQAGEIYESNSFMLEAALRSNRFNLNSSSKVLDTLEATVSNISDLLEENDVLLISGGISVGDYDFVYDALKENDVEEIFYKIEQKPGKPMFFGRKEKKLIFALPGNPASFLVCFYEYVLPALDFITGKSEDNLPTIKKARLKDEVKYSGQRPEFFRARFENDVVEILGAQASSMLTSFAQANCLAYIHGDQKVIQADSVIEIHLI